ncbi:SDR family oxidoreductase [Dyella sp. EPa41]|uniref:SDR family oxidoreductase n=1 Tax=Dyella sp. EPa41 TaxID=1561194 RepID=UPI001915084B|nr:SDR family oxidoreductase [Dyella sp. EPa41]
MKIVVIGGNGLVGRNVVRRLRLHGHDVSAASRVSGVDITTGAGLAEALAGAEVVVDASNSPERDGPASFEFFKAGGTHLLAAETAAEVKHHVSLSVVGTGRLDDSPYLHGKAVQERMIRESSIPFTILHATQFYEFLLEIVERSVYEQTLRLSPAYIQPVASADVAASLAELAVRPPKNDMVEIAGPDRERLSEIIQRFLTEIEAPYDVVTDTLAPYFGARLDDESLLPKEGARICSTGFQAWLGQSEYWGAGW